MTRLERRDLVKGVGAAGVGAAGVVATAGCLETLNGDADDANDSPGDYRGIPGYVDYIPANSVSSEDGGMFAYTDYEQAFPAEKEQVPLLEEQFTDQELEDDTLLRLPDAGTMASMYAMLFTLGPFGFDDEIMSEQGDDETMDGIMSVNTAIVLLGEFDPDAVAASTAGFDQYADQGNFEIYEGVDTDDDADEGILPFEERERLAYAVSEDAIVASIEDESTDYLDGIDLVEEITAAATGDADTIADAHDSLDWALGTAGRGDLVYGLWNLEHVEESVEQPGDGEEIDFQEEFAEDAGLMVSSLDLDSETVTGQLAIQFDEAIDDEIEASLDEYVGQTADDRDRRTDDDRAFVSGTWEV